MDKETNTKGQTQTAAETGRRAEQYKPVRDSGR